MGAARLADARSRAGHVGLARPLLRCAAAAVLLSCAPRGESGPAPAIPRPAPGAPVPSIVFPDSNWARWPVPEAAGYSTAALDSVGRWFERSGSTAAMIVVGGRALVEHGDTRLSVDVGSLRESVYSILYGLRSVDGEISLDQTLADLPIDDAGLFDAERQATVRQVLAARSGIFIENGIDSEGGWDAPPRGTKGPGEYFLHTSWGIELLNLVFERATGTTIFAAFDADLVSAIDLRDFDLRAQERLVDPDHEHYNPTAFNLSTRDIARIGYLMLHDGRWRDRQVVAADWVEESTRPVTRLTEMNPEALRTGRLGFGYGWWVFDDPNEDPAIADGFLAIGERGQYLAVLPALDMVVAHTVSGDEDALGVPLDDFLALLDQLVAARCQNVLGSDSTRMCTSRQPRP